MLAGQTLVRLGLHERLIRGGQRGFAHLAEPGLALRDRRLRLRHGGALVAIVELDQDVPPTHRLAFCNRNPCD